MARRFLDSDSLVFRFFICCMVCSLTPLLILVYLLAEMDSYADLIAISHTRMLLLVLLSSFAALLALIWMARRLFRLARLNQSVRKVALRESDSSVVSALAVEEGEVGDIAKCFGLVLRDLRDTEKELVEARRTIHNPLANVKSAVTFSANFQAQVSLILELISEVLVAENGAILIYSEEDRLFRMSANVTSQEAATDDEIFAALKPSLDLLHSEERILVVPKLNQTGSAKLFGPPAAYVAIIAKGNLLGAVCISRDQPGRNFGDSEIQTLSNIADRLAVALTHFQAGKNDDRTYFEAMRVLAHLVELRDPFLGGHAERVADYSRRIGKLMGLDRKQLKTLRDAALVHDIGNVGVPSSILTKPRPLDAAQISIISKHPITSANMLKPLASYRDILDPIRHHHECLDGSGYPDGLSGTAVTPLTRILGVANIFDALTSDRAHRPAYPVDKALKIMRQLAQEKKIDRDVLKALDELVEEADPPSGSAKLITPAAQKSALRTA